MRLGGGASRRSGAPLCRSRCGCGHLVQILTMGMLPSLFRGRQFELRLADIMNAEKLYGTLSHFSLGLGFSEMSHTQLKITD